MISLSRAATCPSPPGAGPDEARCGSNVRQAFLHLPFKAAWKILRHERELSRGIFELDFLPGSCGVTNAGRD